MPIAYSYIRFSHPTQMKGDSLRRQLSRSEEFAQQHGLELDTTMRDPGVSAYTGANRHKGALSAFLAKVEAGGIARGSYLIVENLDRLSREQVLDALPVFMNIINAGILVATLNDRFIFSRESINKNPMELTISIMGFVKGNRESEDKSERLREVWAAKRRGVREGGRKKLTRQGPGWLTLVPDDPRHPLIGNWVINERGEIVQRIFRWCVDGLGKEAIARRLNEHEVPPFKYGDGWQASAVAELLSDRRVIGELQLYTKRAGKRLPDGEPVAGYFPAIIGEDLFYRAQAEINNRYTGARPGKRGKVPNLFVGLARCSCGRKMEFRDKKSPGCAPGKAVYLICSGAQRNHQCENNRHFTYSETESLILDWVTDIEVSDEEASLPISAAHRLEGKIAERDDYDRRAADCLSKWEIEADPTLRDHLYRSADRNAKMKAKVEEEIAELEKTVRETKRTVILDRRAAVRRLRDRLRKVEGQEMFDLRAKLASALRAVLDHLDFHPDGTVRVTVKGGLKLYRFRDGNLDGTFDLKSVHADDDPLLAFPTVAFQKDRGLAPLTMSSIRKTLEEMIGNTNR